MIRMIETSGATGKTTEKSVKYLRGLAQSTSEELGKLDQRREGR